MSRGLGRIERAIIEILSPPPGQKAKTWILSAHHVAQFLTDPMPEDAVVTTSLLVSVRRALTSLERKGQVRRIRMEGRVRHGWEIMPNAGKEEMRRRRAERRRRQDEEVRRQFEEPRLPPAAPGKYDRLSKLLGMLGSDHAGERDAAAAAVESERRRLGLSWQEILRS